MTEEEEFIQSLYDEAEKQTKEVYKEQKKSRDELLQELASIMLTYTISDGLMSLTRADKTKEYERLSKLITKSAKSQGATQEKVIEEILSSTVNKTFDFYSYNAKLKDVKKIIEDNFKGKHFSERVWENETDVAKHLHKQVNDFLNGKVNVNQIKKDIERTYNTSAYNAKRLTETEVSRVQNDSFKRLCVETGVERLKYNATLDSKTCNDCAQYDGKIYEFGREPDLPRHPLCRCFYEIADDNGTKENIDQKNYQDSKKNDSEDSNNHDEGDILNKAKLLFDSKTRAKIKEFNEGLKDIENTNLKTLLEQSQKRTKFSKSKRKGSYFNKNENTIYLKEGTETSTVAHELFHEIDYKYGISGNDKIIKQIQNDYSKLKNMAIGYGKDIDEMLYSKYPEIFEINDFGNKAVLNQYRGMSDIIHGMSSGKINLGYGHWKKGYWERENALSKETWAQYGRIFYESDDKVIKVLNEIFPETSSEIIKLLKEMVK